MPDMKYQNQQVYAPYVAEFVGTAAIATTTALVAGNSGHGVFGISPFGPVVVGLMYLVMTYAFAGVSGAHFNPAVSLAAMLSKRLRPKQMLGYVVVQYLAGFIGIAVGNGMSETDGYNAAGPSFVWGEAFFVEVAFAAILIHVYLLTVDAEDGAKTGYHGMAVGFTFLGLSTAAANISGGVFNPAVGLPLQVINDNGTLWGVYTFAPLAAAVIAAFVGFFTLATLSDGSRAFLMGGALLFEFFHTGALVCVTALVGRGYISDTTVTANPWAAIVIGLFYGAQVYAGYNCSGGLLNPALSFAVYATQKRFHTRHPAVEDVADRRVQRLLQFIAYVVIQVIGAIVGALVAVRMFATDALSTTAEFYPQVASGQSSFQVFTIEFFFVFALTLCYLSTARANATKGNQFFGLAFGFVFLSAGLAYAQSVISFNPATAIALVAAADADGLSAGGQSWIFIVAPFLAAAAATVVNWIVNEPEFVEVESNRSWNNIKAPFMEFVGTFLFVFTISATAGGANTGLTAIAAGSFLAAIIFTGGHVSGGHFNPAVTLGIFLSRRNLVTWRSGLVWITAQVVGGLMGGAVGNYVTGADPGPAPAPAAGVANADWLAFLTEFLFTAFLVYSVLVTGTSKAASGNSYFGIAIGFCVVTGALAAGHLSGGAFNPAVAVGLVANNGTSAVTDKLWIYLVAEALGAAAAAGVFTITFEQEVLGAASRMFDAIRKAVAEFWGTFFVFLTTALTYSRLTGLGAVTPATLAGQTALSAIAVGAAYVAATYQAGVVSGAHFNPAVTLSTTLCAFTDPGTLVSYAVAQLLGAIAAGLVASSMSLTTTAFAPMVAASDRTFRAMVAEFIFTGIIVIAALATIHSRTRKGNNYFGIVIGFAWVAGSAAAFSISQAAFNPATTGLVAVNGTVAVADDLFLYWVGPLLGALAGAVLYRISNGKEFVDLATVVEEGEED